MFYFSENQIFLKETLSLVLDGEGVGWLRLSRLRKLLEEESNRQLTVQRIARHLEAQARVSPDDHVQDIQISRAVWKGLLRVLQALIAGLEHSYTHRGAQGGLQSAFPALETAHTHFWAKDGCSESHVSTATCSQGSSPFGSQSDLRSHLGEEPGEEESQSQSEDVSPQAASEAGSMTVNPVYGTRLLSTASQRTTLSDSEIEVR